jgi:hypothetical protein
MVSKKGWYHGETVVEIMMGALPVEWKMLWIFSQRKKRMQEAP